MERLIIDNNSTTVTTYVKVNNGLYLHTSNKI